MSDKRTIFKAFLDREKEEQYLNEMNEKGWKLLYVKWAFYTFEKAQKGQYKTVLHYVSREDETEFTRSIVECGCEKVHRQGEGKNVLVYINVPTCLDNAEFLTDYSSKMEFLKNLIKSNKRDILILLIGDIIVSSSIFGCIKMLLPAITKILTHAPEKMLDIFIEEPIIFLLVFLGAPLYIAIITVMLLTMIWVLIKNKKRISKLKAEMKIYE